MFYTIFRLRNAKLLGLVFLGGFSLKATAGVYSIEKLIASGVGLKDGMYYCPSKGAYIRPYDTSHDVKECEYISQIQKICALSPYTRWISGRCFCPELNSYVEGSRRDSYSDLFFGYSEANFNYNLSFLSFFVGSCPKFNQRTLPYGRSVILRPTQTGFVVKKLSRDSLWDNRDDFPGEQGNPKFPVVISTFFKISIGFGWSISHSPVIPNLGILSSNLKELNSDVYFFGVPGELSSRRYLEGFIYNRLPIAQIEKHGDATYFLHDLFFHVFGFLLLPKEIRILAQKQSFHLLKFIDWFNTEYPKESKQPQFRLMIQKLIEHQVSVVDAATANLVQHLYGRIKKETSLSAFLKEIFLERFKNVHKNRNLFLYHDLVAIFKGIDESRENRSVREFVADMDQGYLWGFDKEDKQSRAIFRGAIKKYIMINQFDAEFTNILEVDTLDDLMRGGKGKYGRSLVDLFIERLSQLQNNENKRVSRSPIFQYAYKNRTGFGLSEESDTPNDYSEGEWE